MCCCQRKSRLSLCRCTRRFLQVRILRDRLKFWEVWGRCLEFWKLRWIMRDRIWIWMRLGEWTSWKKRKSAFSSSFQIWVNWWFQRKILKFGAFWSLWLVLFSLTRTNRILKRIFEELCKSYLKLWSLGILTMEHYLKLCRCCFEKCVILLIWGITVKRLCCWFFRLRTENSCLKLLDCS